MRRGKTEEIQAPRSHSEELRSLHNARIQSVTDEMRIHAHSTEVLRVCGLKRTYEIAVLVQKAAVREISLLLALQKESAQTDLHALLVLDRNQRRETRAFAMR